MKLAYISYSKIPSREANSIHVMKMCSAFAKAPAFAGALASADAHAADYEEHTVTLFVPDGEQAEQNVSDIFEYYGVPENFEVKKIGLRFPRIPRFRTYRKCFRMARYVSRNDYDCIYGRDLRTAFFLCCIFRKAVFFEIHSAIETGSPEGSKLRKMIKSGRLKKIIVITQALKEYFISQYGLEDSMIYVSPDGADAPPGSVVPAALTEKSKGMFNIGYIGQLYKGKGMELLGDIAKTCPFAFFHIVGGNDEDIEFWKAEYSGIDNIHFCGYVPPSRTVSYGMSMDVLIAPYQNDVYGAGSHKLKQNIAKWMSPLKIFEYMALGKPIISSDMPVLREVLTDGVNALLCPPDDAGAWSDAIKKLHADKKLAAALAERVSTDFKEYSWETRAKNLIKDVFMPDAYPVSQ